MPLDKKGNYHMNPHRARMSDSEGEAPPKKDIAPPEKNGNVADPLADLAAETITLTKNPDGTVSCDDGSGEPSVHASMAEALEYLNSMHGEQQEQVQAAPQEPAEDLAGMYAKPQGA